MKSHTLIKKKKAYGSPTWLTIQGLLHFNQVDVVHILGKIPYCNQVIQTSQSSAQDVFFEDPYFNVEQGNSCPSVP